MPGNIVCKRDRTGATKENLRDITLKKEKLIHFDFGTKDHTNNDVAFAILKGLDFSFEKEFAQRNYHVLKRYK